jgi:murein biosynthesis integral membrane protein MurJ
MDAYLVALLLPDVAMQLARTGAFNFIPLFAVERARSEDEAWRAAGKMLSYWLLLLLGALLVAYLVSAPALALIAPGFGGARRAQTLELTRLLLLMTASLGAGRILAVVLHAERRFLAVGLSEVAFQVGSTAFLVVHHQLGIEALALAQVFGGFLQFLVVALALLRRRDRLRAGFDISSAPVRRLIRLTLPVYLGDTGDKVNLAVTRAFASLLPTGAVSALQYAYTPVEGLHRALAGPLTTALFPFLSSRFAGPDQRGARASLGRAAVTVAVLFLPLTAVVWLLADPLVVVLFERGSFNVASTRLTASALRLFAPSVFALALNELLGSSFHARQDTLTPMRAGFVRVAANAVLCAALAPSLGHRGLALAATVSVYVKLAVLGFSLRGVYTASEARHHLRTFTRVLLAVGAMTAAVYPIAAFGSSPAVLEGYAPHSLGALALLCLSAYAAALWLFARRTFLVHVALLRRALLRRRHPAVSSGVAQVEGAGPGGGVATLRLRAGLRRTAARAFRLRAGREPGLRVLTYHRVNDAHPRDRLSVHPRAFAEQMEVLARSGRPVIPLAEALSALRGAVPLPDGAVSLTFDDGFEDNATEALPLLDRFGLKATFFIVTGCVGSSATLERYGGCCAADHVLDWDEVRELLARGHAIGGHGRTHRELATLPLAEVRAEVDGCRRDIEGQTGQRARLFCYPRGSENAAVRRIVAEAGFEAACTVRPGPNAPGGDLLALRRTEISGHDTLTDFRLKLEGGFDAWHRFVQRAQARRPR